MSHIDFDQVCEISRSSTDRVHLAVSLMKHFNAQNILELGVWKGQFAEMVLQEIPNITNYWMLDPWRNLDNWNKPFNVGDAEFQKVHDEAMSRTDFAIDKRRVLRGTTREKIDEIADGQLDFAYIDGDHTLKGISIDLLSVWPKIRDGGIVLGDDFSSSIWQHS